MSPRALPLIFCLLLAGLSLACTQSVTLPQLFASATPSVTLTPTATATPTLTPTPTQTPTPVPAARIAAADQALFDGDWDQARADYQTVLANSPDPALLAAAQLGSGKARLNAGDLQRAIGDFNTFLQNFPDSPQRADAYFLLGEAYRASWTWAQAIEAYQRYEQLRPGVIDSYVEERIGEAAFYNGNYASAILAYQTALGAPRTGDNYAMRELLAEAYLKNSDTANALAQYDALARSDAEGWRKGKAEFLAGQTLYAQGQTEAAYTHFLNAVNQYPDAPDAFQALVTLVNDGVPVNELQRGLTNYHAQNYDRALAAFERYLTDNPQADATALYYTGLTQLALKQTAAAIATFRQVIANHPNDPYWAKAYFQIAFIQDYPHDVQTFIEFVAAAPAAAEAPDALYRAARLCERNTDFQRAAELWGRIATEYPASAEAADAAMQAGLVFYRSADYASASQRFEQASKLGADHAQHARAWLWLGKVKEKLGETEGARQAWQKAAQLDPHGYYSLRATQLLNQVAPFSASPSACYAAPCLDLNRERAIAERWLRDNFPAVANVDALHGLSPTLQQEARFIRGAELWRLGLLREAHAEFTSLRLALSDDPLSMWQLANYFHDLGAHDLAIRSARQLVDLAGLTDTLTAPRYILRLRYPTPFNDRVVSAAGEYQLHPFLMYAKMRIESFFWKYALSSAEARGLNQIIPPTADDIARRLNLSNFTYEDLYRPAVSIPMGAFYLNFIGGQAGEDYATLLAGYYAGPGNAHIWQAMAQDDPDLFIEVIRLPDAKGYVQTAFEYFEEYKELYGGR